MSQSLYGGGRRVTARTERLELFQVPEPVWRKQLEGGNLAGCIQRSRKLGVFLCSWAYIEGERLEFSQVPKPSWRLGIFPSPRFPARSFTFPTYSFIFLIYFFILSSYFFTFSTYSLIFFTYFFIFPSIEDEITEFLQVPELTHV